MAAQPVDETLTEIAVQPPPRRPGRRAKPAPMDPRRAPSGALAVPPGEAAGPNVGPNAGPNAEPTAATGTGPVARPTGIAAGVAAIRAALRTMPSAPGVYRMLDRKGDALYVGKARNLKSRVQNYTHPAALSNRLRRMVAETATMDVVVTHTEVEALLLECNLIKRLMPRYNVLLRDDKSFPLIHIGAGHDFPQLTKHRGARNKDGSYFGPFASAGAVNRTLITLAEGVSAALVQRQHLYRPHPAVPAVPDQAVQRALCRPHRAGGLRGADRRGARFSVRQQRRPCSSASPARCSGRRTCSISRRPD